MPIHYSDYKPPQWEFADVQLTIDLDEERTIIASRIGFCHKYGENRLILNGVNLDLLSVMIDGETINDYKQTDQFLILDNMPKNGILEIKVAINPKINRSLEGLYVANGIFTTQCEAEGFRKITYFLDRPDVLCRYRVIMRAPANYPILLSNGNRIETGQLTDGRNFAIWDDPHPKPSYLFAMVAGNLAEDRDYFTTKSGRRVQCSIWFEPAYHGRTAFAMRCLKSAMKYDEDRFNLEYDGDIFQIVAITDFNMGAMENKSLNIFNAKYILAHPEKSLDRDFMAIDSIIAHEYFHNWTGNRVTLRDWFQLSLKEGLTVFRDQEYTKDHYNRSLARIEDVRVLRTQQFSEDASNLAHPIRPESYMTIDNFYTATIYEKGAEIIGMMHRILGDGPFLQGFTNYINANDGKPAIIEDLVNNLFANSHYDKNHLMQWYSTPGTPLVTVRQQYNPKRQELTLIINQNNDKDPHKNPALIPIKIALLHPNGQIIPINGQDEALIICNQHRQKFIFKNINQRPVLSFNRDFTAPIMVNMRQSLQDKLTIMRHDTDHFNRWQEFFAAVVNIICHTNPKMRMEYKEIYFTAFAEILANTTIDNGFRALLLQPPTILECAEGMEIINPKILVKRRNQLITEIAQKFQNQILQNFNQLANITGNEITGPAINNRALQACLLQYIAQIPGQWGVIVNHYRTSPHFEGRYSALWAGRNNPNIQNLLQDFYHSIQGDEIMLDKYLALCSAVESPKTLKNIQNLIKTTIKIDKPNQIRALLFPFATQNIHYFHQPKSYQFIFDIIKQIDEINPQNAARITNIFKSFHKLTPKYQKNIGKHLQILVDMPHISTNLADIAKRLLD